MKPVSLRLIRNGKKINERRDLARFMIRAAMEEAQSHELSGFALVRFSRSSDDVIRANVRYQVLEGRDAVMLAEIAHQELTKALTK